MENRYTTDQQQVLVDLARDGSQNRRETSTIVSPGGDASIWAITIKSHVQDNVYMVRAVMIEATGFTPTEFGAQMEATNLAESFQSPGTVSPGTHAIMCRLGENNVFYAVP